MSRETRELILIILLILLAILAIIGGIWYAQFQFDLCYPEVSDSWWYCLQHAT